MPIYNYLCNSCDHEQEEVHGIKENPKIKCHKCNKKMERTISLVSRPIFKGSGFYETDYKNK